MNRRIKTNFLTWSIRLPVMLLVFNMVVLEGRAQETSYFPQIMNGSYQGAGYQTIIRILNTGGEAEARIEFFDNQGIPSGLDLEGSGETRNSFSLSLKSGERVTLRSSGEGDFWTGFASLTAPSSVAAEASFVGIDTDTGVLLYEAAVPPVYPVYEFSVILDSLGEWDTGLAMIPVSTGVGVPAAGEDETDITITLRDSRGDSIGEKTFTAAIGEKISRYIYELFSEEGAAVEMEGSVGVASSRFPLAAISARQRLWSEPFPLFVPTLTVYPVFPEAFQVPEESSERIMVFAPHPDDEALACSGVIHSSLGKGEEVRVVIVTCGDAYLGAADLLVSEYPHLAHDRDGDGDFDMLDYGILRHEESLAAMDALGLDESDVVFLGYPDAGIDDLWNSDDIYTSPHTGASSVPDAYDFARSVGKPYNRESLLSDIKSLIREFRPTLLFSPRDTDHHQDHWSTGRFVTQALTELHEFREWNYHYGYLVHWEANEDGWPHDSMEWEYPTGHAPWQTQLFLADSYFTPQMKRAVINRYFSQLIPGGNYLLNFAKESEVFWLEGIGGMVED